MHIWHTDMAKYQWGPSKKHKLTDLMGLDYMKQTLGRRPPVVCQSLLQTNQGSRVHMADSLVLSGKWALLPCPLEGLGLARSPIS